MAHGVPENEMSVSYTGPVELEEGSLNDLK